MRFIFFIFMFLQVSLFAEVTDCTKVFEERKDELLKEIEKIDEARQSFEALRAASNVLFEKKDQALDIKQKNADMILSEIKEREESIKKMLKKNEDLLAEIKNETANKLSETYNKMKDGAAASILEQMDRPQAASILYALTAKKVSKIMAKMAPLAASEVTVLLTKGPPFDTNVTKE